MVIKDISNTKINSVNPLYLIINKINQYVEGNNGDNYLTVVLNDESKGILKKYEELWDKIKRSY